ncbi:leucine-rich repeat containing protein [Microscilla marina ATCC 23134]|uniref:Leucine-rich repeat containing protein n=2 Tax=Microscilla marina TaxID=1027 RepID=A1ZFJ4_MICM2|nr:leucine-rich repeat containing protein [Microscilla marina ATCC 23134]
MKLAGIFAFIILFINLLITFIRCVPASLNPIPNHYFYFIFSKKSMKYLFAKTLFFTLLCSVSLTAQDSSTPQVYTSMKEALKNPEKVIKLDLRKQKLRKFPKNIIKCKNIEELNLSDNFIDSLPKEISKLTKLKKLHLSNNRLVHISFEINLLDKLIFLNLGKNHLRKFPIGLCNMTKLEELYLWENYFKTIPTSIRSMRGIRYIDLSKNPIPYRKTFIIQKYLPKAEINFW